MCFESFDEAKQRHEIKKQTVTTTTKKSPVGRIENMEWDKESLMEEVSGYEDDLPVNWSELARKFQVRNKSGELARNGGQIVQQYLKSEGVDVSRFRKTGSNDDSRIRKKMKRSAGGKRFRLEL